jgi:hypothetical protein
MRLLLSPKTPRANRAALGASLVCFFVGCNQPRSEEVGAVDPVDAGQGIAPGDASSSGTSPPRVDGSADAARGGPGGADASSQQNPQQVTLTVEKLGEGKGVVDWRDGSGLTCGSDCSESFPRAAMPVTLTLTAFPQIGSTFGGWAGCTSASASQCTVTLAADSRITATFLLKSRNLAFVTSTTYLAAELGDINAATADRACNERARAAGLSGDYASYPLGRARLPITAGWLRVDGKPFSGQPFGRVMYPLLLDEYGTSVAERPPAFASFNPGCPAGESFVAGDPTAGTGAWDPGFVGSEVPPLAPCTTRFRLYCFGTAETPLAEADTLPVVGRLAFVAPMPFDQTWSGLAGADRLCQTTAERSGANGTFKALLSTTSASAASRFDISEGSLPWVRPDGIPLVAKAADLFRASGRLLSAFQVQLERYGGQNAHGFASSLTWSGSDNPLARGSAATTCDNWTGPPGATGVAGRMSATWLPTALGAFNMQPCAPSTEPSTRQSQYLYCLQE